MSPLMSEIKKEEWLSNIEVARKVLGRFDDLTTYSAKFKIEIKTNNRKRSMNGRVYYKKPNLLRYEFSSPKGNLVVADGKIMWFYIDRLKIVGKQNLIIGENTTDNVFSKTPVSGLRRMFKKYHYRFDTLDQPRKINKDDPTPSYVFLLEQREKIGGYSELKLFINSETMLVHQVDGDDGYGKQTSIIFSDIKENPKLPGQMFTFKVESHMSVVSNPLVDEEKR